jgi:hypothetical protein
LDNRWLILYLAIYMFGIWDSYRTTVDLNKQYILADREDAQVLIMQMGLFDVNYLDKRKPSIALIWSTLFPGLGHLYLHHVITGFFIFVYAVAICYLGHIPKAINYSMVGEFTKAINELNMQWTIYFPSIYFFIIYDSYVLTIEHNKLFEKEMSKYLRQKYQSKDFLYPL